MNAATKETPYHELPAYAQGYQTGLTWKENYRPGGPFCFGPNKYDTPEKQAIAQRTMDNYRDWFLGFDDARAEVAGQSVEPKKV